MTVKIIFCLYILLCIIIGLISSHKTNKIKTSHDFLTAGSNQHFIIVGFSLFAACVSGSQIVGVSDNYFLYGLAAVTYNLTRVILTLGMGRIVASKIYRVKHIAVNQLFGQLFHPHDSILFGITSSLILVGVAGASIRAAARILPSLFPYLSNHLILSLTLITFLCVLISTIGGIRATNITNVLHTIYIVFGIFLISIFGIQKFGGLSYAIHSMPNIRGNHWFDFGGIPIANMIGSFLGVMVYSYVGQTEWNISRSARNAKDATFSFYLSGILQLILSILLIGVGMTSVLLNHETLNGQNAFVTTAASISPYLEGISVSAILACSISTAQGMYIAQSTISLGWLTNYYSKKNKILSNHQQILFLKLLIPLLGSISFIFCFMAEDLIAFLINLLSIYTPFSILLILVFYYPKLCRKSTCTWVFVFSIMFLGTFLLIPPIHTFFSNTSAYPLLIGTVLGIVIPLLSDSRIINTNDLFREE